MHTPVFAQEVIDSLQIIEGGKYIDATAGEGGHTQMILDKGGFVLGLDWDENQIKNLQSKIQYKKVLFVQSNYAAIEKVAKAQHFYPVDGVLFDFGLSMRQIRESGRGFSFNQPDEILDMRIGQDGEDARYYLNYLSEAELYENFSRFSEDLNSQEIAAEVVRSRRLKKIETVGDLTKVIDSALEKSKNNYSHRNKEVYARIFQAVRIMVNKEFENIKNGLEGAISLLKPDGRIVFITFHSLEDRIVKQLIKEQKEMKELPKPKIPFNKIKSFERSALIRVITKI